MTGSAKVIIKQQDRSAIVPSLSGIDIGTVVNSKWGPITPPTKHTQHELVNNYSTPDNSKGSSWNGAELLLANSNKVWITRAIHGDARYSASLVRFKIDSPDFNNYLPPSAKPDPVVKAINSGLGLSDFDSYTFPLYSTNRVYENTTSTVFIKTVNDNEVEVTSLISAPSAYSLSAGDNISFGPSVDDSSDYYTIESAQEVVKVEHIVTTSGPITVTAGTELKKYVSSGVATSYSPKIYVAYDVVASNSVTVTGHDSLIDSDSITFDNASTTVTAISKSLVNRTAKVLTLNSNVTVSAGDQVQWMKSSEFEYRDAFLVMAKYPGDLGNNIKIGIRNSTNYSNAFWVDVYYKGDFEESESFEVTRDNFLDGFGNQMQIETKINGVSKWILVKNNLADETSGKPLETSTGVWRRNSTDLFLATSIVTNETIVKGDILATVSDSTNFTISDRIKFSLNGYEYKVNSKSGNTLTLDRPIIEDTISIGSTIHKFDNTLSGASCTFTAATGLVSVKKHTLVDGDTVSYSSITNTTGIAVNTNYYVVEATEDTFKLSSTIGGAPLTLVGNGSGVFTHNVNGIFNGTQYYKFSQIPYLTEYSIDDQYTISSTTGVVLDAGTNNSKGGFDGSNITLFDVISAFQKMGNKEKYRISIFCDNGFAYPEVAIALDEMSKATNLSHAYNSVPYAAELQSDVVSSVTSYRNSTNINSEYSSLFSGWIKVTDVYNQTRVWVAPSVFGVNTQSFVTRNYYIFTPAAGWVYGRLNGLDITVKYTEGQRDALIDSQINPIRYREGWGLSVWGNETMYVKPSALQLRSVAMLLIILKYGLENYLEYKLFAMNNNPTWTEVESAISIFIRDTLYTPGGLYAYQVHVKKVITDTDIDNRRMPVFVGIQPTLDIKQIPVTLAIFNKSVSISI